MKWPWSKVGHSVSHIIDARQRNIMSLWIRIRSESEEGWYLQRSTSLEHINGTTMSLAVFDINGSEVMVTRQRADERSKGITQTHWGRQKMRWDCPQPDTNANKCHVQEWHTADMTMMLVPFSPPFLASTSLFLHKLEEDTICLLYKPILVHLTSPRKERLEWHHYDWIRCHQGLTSLTKEELSVFSCLESLKR